MTTTRLYSNFNGMRVLKVCANGAPLAAHATIAMALWPLLA
jgi:hypothetical protein